ncbi:MAG: DUF1445 domain-containing protein [Planctomycetes bacterium]|nr:DUF1445 domain-containing protein [Planctomycetota bacterium]
MMHKDFAEDFQKFCEKNPISCPLLGVTEPGQKEFDEFGEDINLCTDLSSYDIIEYGSLAGSRTDVNHLYNKEMVTFLIGSSVSFDGLMREKGLGPSFGPAVYATHTACESVGPYVGNMAVTMRSFDPSLTQRVIEFTSHFPKCHGAPLSINDWKKLGIGSEDSHLTPEPLQVPDGHDKLYWACGITPSLVAREAKLPLMIVHTSGHALVTSVKTESLYE